VNDAEIYESNLKYFHIAKRYGDKAQCRCPSHDDKQASLTISKGRKCTLFFCHAGCSVDEILTAAGLKKENTYYDAEPQKTNWRAFIECREKRKIEAVYNYVSCNGSYAFTKVRLEGKKIIYGMLKDDRFTYGLGHDKPRKAYKAIYGSIQALNKAISEGRAVFIPEGEKDTDTLTKQGYTAFTYGGANDWQADFATLVQGATVFILADNDAPGKKVAETILNDVQEVAKSAKIIVPMPDIPKADITDYFKAGHSKEEFEKMLQNTVTENRIRTGEQEEIDLIQFHIVADNGKITGVYHNAIFEYIKSHYNIFIVGGTPYIYDSGYFKVDVTGARLKSIIRKFIYPPFIKSTTINNIYNLFLQDISLELQFEQLNYYPSYWICFQNGMYDTKEKRLLPHSPKYRAINQIPHDYKPDAVISGAKTDEYLNFICEDSDSKEMLLQFIGYSLTKDVGQQKFLVLNGIGGTGKSTLIRLIEALTGSRNVSNISLTDLQQRFASFGLMGKLLNSCADLEIQALEDTSIIKKILGEDTLRAEQKGHDAISFKSYAKLIFSTNELPLVKSEKTNGFYRRLLVLTMNKVPVNKNPNLFHELEQEIEYLLHLAVQAVERMYQQGIITVADVSDRAVQQLWNDSDTVQAFLHEMCVKDEKGRIERTELYKKYSDYCEDTDRQSLTKNNFYKSLRAKGYSEIKTSGYIHFKGILFIKEGFKRPEETALNGFMSVTQEQLDELPFQ
jgi:P4 family phage/plasmid primase-like protien